MCVCTRKKPCTQGRLQMPRAAALSIRSSVLNDKTSRINIGSLVAETAALYSASPLECARAFCLRDAEYSRHLSTSIFRLD